MAIATAMLKEIEVIRIRFAPEELWF